MSQGVPVGTPVPQVPAPGEEHEVEPFRPDLSPSGQLVSVPSAMIPATPVQSLSPSEVVLDTRPFGEDDGKHCLANYVDSTWFARRGIARDLVFTEIAASNSYVSQLETFTESRKLVPDHRPHKSLSVDLDDARYGPPPGAWDIIERPQQLFRDEVKHISLPHTEELRFCFQCRGRGELRCGQCHGHGTITCHTCHGHGHIDRTRTTSGGGTEHYTENCSFCHHGHRDCHACHRSGWVRCHICDGFQRLIHFIRLDIEWRNTRRSVTVDAHDPILDSDERSALLGSSAIAAAEGPLVLQEEDVALAPREDIPSVARINGDVNRAVNKMIAESGDSNVLQHRQRLSIRGVPVYRVSYMWKGSSKNFWVMGTNRQVFAPGFPNSPIRVTVAVLLVLVLVLAVVGAIGAGVYFVLYG